MMTFSALVILILSVALILWAIRMIWNIHKGARVSCRSCSLYSIPTPIHRGQKACTLCGQSRTGFNIGEATALPHSVEGKCADSDHDY